MPYLFSQAEKYGYATAYHGVTHPSLPNYIAIASGGTQGVSDNGAPSANPVRSASVFGQAIDAGGTARVYAETMPSNCQRADSGDYAVHHNPWPYFTGETADCARNDVPESQLSADVAAGRLPTVGMVVPNMCNDAHDCSLGTADSWLKQRLEAIYAGPDWRSGHLAVVVTADEDDGKSGNTVLTAVIHPSQDHNVVSAPLTHYSLTRLYEDVAGAPYLGAAGSATDMAAAFGLPVG
jgi:acid phosphatase